MAPEVELGDGAAEMNAPGDGFEGMMWGNLDAGGMAFGIGVGDAQVENELDQDVPFPVLADFDNLADFQIAVDAWNGWQ